MQLEFKSEHELYNRLKPALKTKQTEMKRCGFSYIEIDDIWNYFKEEKWKNAINLSLYEIVSDIMNTDNLLIDKYLKNKLSKQNRETYFE